MIRLLRLAPLSYVQTMPMPMMGTEVVRYNYIGISFLGSCDIHT